ncbi:MAG: oligopeptide ABC transporter permease [Brevinema sp.]
MMKQVSPSQLIWQRFKKNKSAFVGLICFGVIVVVVIFLPFVIPYGRDEINFALSYNAPSLAHPLGTDELGRDVLVRLLHGGRISLQISFLATFMSAFLGCLVGGVSGFYGGKIDFLLMRFTEIVNSFPFLPFAITLSAAFGAGFPAESRIYITAIILGLLGWTGLARLIRGQILSLKEQEFMVAAEALGISPLRRIWRHLLPNTYAYVIVSMTLSVAGVILTEAGLSFLGLGAPQPTPTWGNMIQSAQTPYTLVNRPWIWLSPGMAILLTIISINLVGEGLREAVSPKE